MTKKMDLGLDITEAPIYQEMMEKVREEVEKKMREEIEKGKISTLLSLYREEIISMEIVLQQIGISEAKFNELLNNPDYQ